MSSATGSLISIFGLALLFGCATTQHQHVAGYVSDAGCGAKHVGTDGADCIRKCIRGGASVGHPEWTPQPMVLVLDGDQRLLIVDNPDALRGLEGKHVILTARARRDHLRVISVEQ